MTTLDLNETIFNTDLDNQQEVAPEATPNNRNASRWQTIAIGGATGIALGVAGTYLMKAWTDQSAAGEKTQDSPATTDSEVPVDAELHQATVDQTLSFPDAFAAARAEVGAGGVFLWHGRLFNTYTAEEWQGMSEAQKDEFADEVQPYLSQQTVEVQQTSHPVQHDVAPVEEVAAEPEVHFLGVETRQIEGQIVNIGHMSVDESAVALVDVDNDHIFDVSLIDTNRNGNVEDNEVTDISGRGITVEDFWQATAMQQMKDGLEPADQVAQPQADCGYDVFDDSTDGNAVLC